MQFEEGREELDAEGWTSWYRDNSRKEPSSSSIIDTRCRFSGSMRQQRKETKACGGQI
jgi:hypothetical protein